MEKKGLPWVSEKIRSIHPKMWLFDREQIREIFRSFVAKVFITISTLKILKMFLISRQIFKLDELLQRNCFLYQRKRAFF